MDGQYEKSCDLFTCLDNLTIMLTLFTESSYIFNHLTHSIPEKDINLDKL